MKKDFITKKEYIICDRQDNFESFEGLKKETFTNNILIKSGVYEKIRNLAAYVFYVTLCDLAKDKIFASVSINDLKEYDYQNIYSLEEISQAVELLISKEIIKEYESNI